MPLSIRNAHVERLARSLSRITGEGLTETILRALQERYQRVRAVRDGGRLFQDLSSIAERTATLSKQSTKDAEEILGYDENGLPR